MHLVARRTQLVEKPAKLASRGFLLRRNGSGIIIHVLKIVRRPLLEGLGGPK
jgi:hypothetical protein